MTTKTELQKRIAELEMAQARAAAIYEISRDLNAAQDADELLRVLARPAVAGGANRAYLSYIDLDEAGEPEWIEIVATWWQKGKDPLPVGSRFYVPTFPFARLWIANPDESQLIANVATNQEVDEATRNLLLQRGTLATAIIPLAQAGHWVGIVGLAWETPHDFSREEIEIYRALMGLGTQAVENQRLFQHLEQLVEERTQKLKETQAALIRQEKLAALGQLAGNIGHELRNPLGVITNAIYFLQMVLPDADETVKEYLDLIASRVDEAEKIVSDLLNLSRIKPTTKESVAVSTLVAETLLRHPPPAQVVVATDLASDLPAVFVDAQQIGQVLSNLVTNAYQAMPQGGELTISAQVVSGGAGDAKRGTRSGGAASSSSLLPTSRFASLLPTSIALTITDTGHGMSPEVMAKVFEPLYTTKTKGIGLGLAVSKNLVELNGGRIEVASKEGQGSSFIVILPTGE
jgi:signal transduction histidine kinase